MQLIRGVILSARHCRFQACRVIYFVRVCLRCMINGYSLSRESEFFTLVYVTACIVSLFALSIIDKLIQNRFFNVEAGRRKFILYSHESLRLCLESLNMLRPCGFKLCVRAIDIHQRSILVCRSEIFANLTRTPI